MINPMELGNRTILVTGASSGIGRETAILLSQLGARRNKSTKMSLFLKKIIQLYPGSEPLSAELSIALPIGNPNVQDM